MTTINLNDSLSDPFYRYKMSRLIVKFEKNGTLLVNIMEIAKQLNRPACHLMKYLSYRKATRFDVKKMSLAGRHQAADLQPLIVDYVREFVICPQCDNPETSLERQSETELKLVCMACGGKTALKKCNQKLINFILNELKCK